MVLVNHYLKKLKTVSLSNYLILIFLFICLLITFIQIRNPIKSKYNIDSTYIEGIIDSIYVSEKNTKIILNGKEKILVYIDINNNYKVGDVIGIKGNIKIPSGRRNFNLFNYNLYLKSIKINYIFYGTSSELISKNRGFIYKIRNLLINRINNYRRKEYFYALILADQTYISDTIKNQYRNNGISHLFAISGTHISILITILSLLLNKFKLTKNVIILIVLFLYLFIIDFPISVTRSFLLYFFITLKKYLNISIPNHMLLVIIFCLFILYNPFVIYNIGFQFSFIVSYSLLFMQKIIIKIKSKILSSLIISLISFTSSIIVSIQNFHTINLLTPIFNLFYVPFVSLIIYPTLLFSLLFKFMGNLLNVEIFILEFLSDKCNSIFSIFHISLSHLSIIGICLYTFLILIIYKCLKANKYSAFILLIPTILIHHNIRMIYSNDSVTMLDVSQGDCSLITRKYSKEAILIDTGGLRTNLGNISKNTIIPYLNSIGITCIDTLILSHGDLDHMGESINLVNNFKVRNVIFNIDKYNDLELGLIKTLERKNIKYFKNVKQLDFEHNKFYFLNTNLYNNENDNSNVIYFNYNNLKFLFMGDAGIIRENDLLKKYDIKNIDVLKVSHHGSKTSSSEKFINTINPKYSIISVGYNRYGHPNNKVLDNLSDSTIYRTDENGSVIFEFKNNKFTIKKCVE